MSALREAYRVSHSKLTLEIRLEEIKRLHLHEEVIPELVERLSDRVYRDAHIKHPIIVDKGTLVVLDGMHRVAVLQRLKCKLIPVCLVDYNNPNIVVKSWFRIVKGGEEGIHVADVLGRLGYSLEEVSRNELDRRVNGEGVVTGVLTSKKCYIVLGKAKDIGEKYRYIKQLENDLKRAGYEIGYETEEDALHKVTSSKVLAVVVPPQITKQDVIDVALAGKVFVHKSTRHVIPARPLFVNVPLDWLRMKPREANKLFIELLSKKRVKFLPPGQTLARRYDEELYVFE